MTSYSTPTAPASSGAIFTAAGACFVLAGLLLGLQILLGWEYTEGGTLGTRASMIGAMVTLAALPVFVAIAWRYGAGLVIAGALAISFVAFLAYSLPATTGRTGEIKEAKATVADDVASWKSELSEITKQLNWAVPDKNAECAGAPSPLPPNGWPACRRKTGTVTALAERQTKLEGQIKAAGTAGATGDLGSTLWAWALSWLGVTAAAIRKSSVLSFAVGLDFAIWSLVALGEYLMATGFAVRRHVKALKGSQPEPSADAPLAANHPALLVNASKGSPDGSANGSTRGGGAPVVAFPVTPKRPSAPNGSTAAPVAKGSEASQREDFERRENVLAFLREEAAVGNVIDRQAYIGETLGIPGSSLSELMSALEAEGAIVRRQDGRRKVITVSQRAFETA